MLHAASLSRPTPSGCRGRITAPSSNDYYGKRAFIQTQRFMEGYDPAEPNNYGMIGFALKNTLSEAGGVTRGLCAMDDSGHLISIRETRDIKKCPKALLCGQTAALRR